MFIPAKFRFHQIFMALVERNREKDRLYKLKMRALDPKKACRVMKEWRDKNPSKWKVIAKRSSVKYKARPGQKQHATDYMRRRRQTEPMFRIISVLRTRLGYFIKRPMRKSGLIELLGCSRDALRAHLESKFAPGMTFDNHGKYGWHLDHIQPLASFSDLSDPVQLKKAWHYTNLQPLWWFDNLCKSKSWNETVPCAT